MKYLLVIMFLLLGPAALAHPHHDCQKEECRHEHLGGPS